MAYEQEKPTIVELIHHRTSEEVLVDACHLTIQLSTAYCRPGNMLSIWSNVFSFISPESGGGHGIDGFVTHLTENFDISEDTCRSAWRTGVFKIDLGKQHVSIPVPRGEPSHTKTSLYLHGSKYTQYYNCSPAYGWDETGPVYRGQGDPFSEKRSHEVVRAELTLQMKRVFSLVDINKQRLYIPSAGKEIDLMTMPQEYTTMSPTIGTIVILKGNLPLDACRQHFHIAGGPAKLYNPTNQDDEEVPKLIRFETEIQSDKRVFGLQLMTEIDICGTQCSETQFKDILVCIRDSEDDFMANKDVQVLDDLGSNSLALLQVNMDKSIQNLMLSLCLLNQKHMLSAMKDIEVYGPSLLNPIHNGRGLRLLQRGEHVITLECPRVTAIPRSEDHGICCNHFPVTLIRKDGTTSDKYLQSITRQVTDTCDPVPCSDIMPIQMRTMSGNSICQVKGHIRNCKDPIILQPKDDVRGNMKLLSASEQKLSTVEGSLPAQIEVWSIISTMKMKSADEMIGKISQQDVRCAGNYCEAGPVSDEFRRKFARASLPYDVHFFSFSMFLKVLAISAVTLFWYEKITALLTIVVSMHSCCRDRNKSFQNITICGMIVEAFCLFSKSCNPLHPRSVQDEIELTRMKRKVKKVQENHEVFIAEQAGLLEDMALNNSADRTGTDPEAFKQLGESVRLQWLEIESIRNTIEDLSLITVSKGKKSKKLRRKLSTKVKKYPPIFSTPESKRKMKNSVRFSIEDTEF